MIEPHATSAQTVRSVSVCVCARMPTRRKCTARGRARALCRIKQHQYIPRTSRLSVLLAVHRAPKGEGSNGVASQQPLPPYRRVAFLARPEPTPSVAEPPHPCIAGPPAPAAPARPIDRLHHVRGWVPGLVVDEQVAAQRTHVVEELVRAQQLVRQVAAATRATAIRAVSGSHRPNGAPCRVGWPLASRPHLPAACTKHAASSDHAGRMSGGIPSRLWW